MYRHGLRVENLPCFIPNDRSKKRLIQDTQDWHPRTGTTQSRSFRILAQLTGTDFSKSGPEVWRERESERERQRLRHRERDRETQRHRDRETQRQREREREGKEAGGSLGRWTDGHRQ